MQSTGHGDVLLYIKKKMMGLTINITRYQLRSVGMCRPSAHQQKRLLLVVAHLLKAGENGVQYLCVVVPYHDMCWHEQTTGDRGGHIHANN